MLQICNMECQNNHNDDCRRVPDSSRLCLSGSFGGRDVFIARCVVSELYARTTIPSRLYCIRSSCTRPTMAPFITAWNAVWNCSISAGVPTVMRTQSGIDGQGRPMYTFWCAMAAMTSVAGLRALSMKQFDTEGEYS